MEPKVDLTSIIKKIKALRARAADAASTEAEALIATRVAADLLAKYNINLTEIDVRAEGVTRERWDSGKMTRPVEAYMLLGINALCGVRSWYRGGVVTVIGAPADVETALYYLDLGRTAIWSCWKTFHKSDEFFRLREAGQSADKIGNSFRLGVSSRLSARMKEMAAAAVAPVTGSSSTALVVVKNGLINKWLVDNKITLRTSNGAGASSSSGYSAGVNAANGVSLNRGIGGHSRQFALA